MRRLNFSIATLMGVVFFLATGFAAIRNPSELVASSVYSLMLVVILVTTVAAVLRRRPPLVGFAIFAWGYLLTAAIGEKLPAPLTSKLLREAYILQQGGRYAGPATGLPSRTGFVEIPSEVTGGMYVVSENTGPFFQIASTWLCGIFGLVGALVGRLLGAPDEPSDQP